MHPSTWSHLAPLTGVPLSPCVPTAGSLAPRLPWAMAAVMWSQCPCTVHGHRCLLFPTGRTLVGDLGDGGEPRAGRSRERSGRGLRRAGLLQSRSWQGSQGQDAAVEQFLVFFRAELKWDVWP